MKGLGKLSQRRGFYSCVPFSLRSFGYNENLREICPYKIHSSHRYSSVMAGLLASPCTRVMPLCSSPPLSTPGRLAWERTGGPSQAKSLTSTWSRNQSPTTTTTQPMGPMEPARSPWRLGPRGVTTIQAYPKSKIISTSHSFVLTTILWISEQMLNLMIIELLVVSTC